MVTPEYEKLQTFEQKIFQKRNLKNKQQSIYHIHTEMQASQKKVKFLTSRRIF